MPRALSEQAIESFRERLIDAAEGLFAEHGPEAVTIRQIAQAIGVSAMTPYRYFKDRDAILAAVRARAFDRFAEALEAAHATAADPPGRAEAMGRAYVRFALDHPQAYKLMFDVRQPDEGRYADLARAGERARRTMTMYVDAPGENTELIGRVYWAALHGPLMLGFAGYLDPPLDAVAVIETLSKALWIGLPATLARDA